MSQYQFSLDNGEVVEVEAATYQEAIVKANQNSSSEEVTEKIVVSITGDEEAAPLEGEVTQPEAAQPTPEEASQKTMTIRDTGVTSFMDPNLYIQMKAMANDFIKSGAIPECWQTAEAVLVGFQTGLEMGMTPMESMNSLYFVKGAINVWGKATTKRLKDHGWTIKYSDESQESCTATVKKGRESYTETFTFKDAELSGYTQQYNKFDKKWELKVGWRPGMNRRKKLRYGVLALIINTYIPEVLGSAIGIVEVSDDYDLHTNQAPAQLADSSQERKAKIAAAEKKQKQLSKGTFKPAAVPSE